MWSRWGGTCGNSLLAALFASTLAPRGHVSIEQPEGAFKMSMGESPGGPGVKTLLFHC